MKFTISNLENSYSIPEYSRTWKFTITATQKPSPMKDYVESFFEGHHDKVQVAKIMEDMIENAIYTIQKINKEWEGIFTIETKAATTKIKSLQAPITIIQLSDLPISPWQQRTITYAFDSDEQGIHHLPAIVPHAKKKHFIKEVLEIWAEYMLSIYNRNPERFNLVYNNKNIHTVLEALTRL